MNLQGVIMVMVHGRVQKKVDALLDKINEEESGAEEDFSHGSSPEIDH